MGRGPVEPGGWAGGRPTRCAGGCRGV